MQHVAVPELAPEFNRQVVSKFDYETTIETLKSAIIAAEIMVLGEIDTQNILKRGGLEVPGIRQILYFHLRFMKRVLELNPNAIIEAPLKFVVRELDDRSVRVHYIAPSYLFGRYSKLELLGDELETIVTQIVKAVEL